MGKGKNGARWERHASILTKGWWRGKVGVRMFVIHASQSLFCVRFFGCCRACVQRRKLFLVGELPVLMWALGLFLFAPLPSSLPFWPLLVLLKALWMLCVVGIRSFVLSEKFLRTTHRVRKVWYLAYLHVVNHVNIYIFYSRALGTRGFRYRGGRKVEGIIRVALACSNVYRRYSDM